MKRGKDKDRLLILFCRNPELGKVKTRLALTVGDEKALAVYYLLTNHTRNIATLTACDKVVYYSDFIDTEDNWPSSVFAKSLQSGADLGERMMQAFGEGFGNGYKSICIIGMDCFELTTEIIEQAFDTLKTHDLVIGPANDGGYYLLGMKHLHKELFRSKRWSSDSVAADTLHDCEKLGLSVFKLPRLTDVDEEKDLPDVIRRSLKVF